MYPEKKYLSGLEGCRTEPYNEIMLRIVLEQLSESCSKPCHDSFFKNGKRLEKIYEHLPVCQSTEEWKCAEKAILKAIEIGEQDIKKPCQTLEYRTDISKSSDLPRNQIQFLLWFQYPAEVNVKEEYLIYDTVNLISSIGGTVGFCIGLSFYTLTNGLMTWLQMGIKRILLMKQRETEQVSKVMNDCHRLKQNLST